MPPDEPPCAPAPPPRPGPARQAAEPLAWWTALLAVYLALVPAISPTEITVGALTAAVGAAAAVAARRVLLTTGTARPPGSGREPAAGRDASRRPVAPVRLLLPPLARLPAQIVADTARITVRGATGGHWTTPAAPPGPAARGAATLLMSASPGTYVGGVDPERGLLRVHRLTGPSPFERSLRRAGLIDDPPAQGPREGGPREGGPR
ncbi:hypothetical protein [Actinomadura citrea]|uniref:Multisubunit Na+/H+ antiporter MnhE subunit n=1 Tax=Actinomadura citrea TaxID=46158 RepID=A0A7Y9KE29_9ACTN|nr:hypothetical protein [Actinomadura citrea]NYE14065.1 multisubunit Na+/H+ antiporter MnhE subunit [Actinomadura citrea]